MFFSVCDVVVFVLCVVRCCVFLLLVWGSVVCIFTCLFGCLLFCFLRCCCCCVLLLRFGFICLSVYGFVWLFVVFLLFGVMSSFLLFVCCCLLFLFVVLFWVSGFVRLCVCLVVCRLLFAMLLLFVCCLLFFAVAVVLDYLFVCLCLCLVVCFFRDFVVAFCLLFLFFWGVRNLLIRQVRADALNGKSENERLYNQKWASHELIKIGDATFIRELKSEMRALSIDSSQTCDFDQLLNIKDASITA